MVRLSRFKPKVVNGIFGVSKPDGCQRLIINDINANKNPSEPHEKDLPDPELIAELYLRKNERIFIAKSDFDNFHDRMKLSDWMTGYFKIPLICERQKERWRVVCSLPMGWSHYVYVGQ